MRAQDILKELRQKHNMTQDQLAEKLSVTRQAVSRWENGESVPNPETLKHLLGDPRKLICQCCGMPLDSDEVISREADGQLNEEYCKWCYTDGRFTYGSSDELLEFLVSHMSNEHSLPNSPEPISARCCRSSGTGANEKSILLLIKHTNALCIYCEILRLSHLHFGAAAPIMAAYFL